MIIVFIVVYCVYYAYGMFTVFMFMVCLLHTEDCVCLLCLQYKISCNIYYSN